MQTANRVTCIKVTSTGKGKSNWENQLLENQEKRIKTFLAPLNIHHTKATYIINLFKDQVDKDNIIKLHSHPIRLFIKHLINGSIGELETFTSINS